MTSSFRGPLFAGIYGVHAAYPGSAPCFGAIHPWKYTGHPMPNPSSRPSSTEMLSRMAGGFPASLANLKSTLRLGVMRAVLAVLVAFALPLDTVAGDSFTVRYDGVGPAKIGMTKAQVSRVLGESLERSPGAGDIECEYLYSPRSMVGVKFMFSRERLARIDISEGATPTEAGIRIGDNIAKIRKAYGGRISVAPHQYIPEPDGKYITVKAPGGRRAIRFETDKGLVVTYYAGRFPEVTFVEGCL